MPIEARFQCQSVTPVPGGEHVRFTASTGPGSESWSKFTPSGNLDMTITNPAIAGAFEIGKVYALTLAPVDE